MHGLLAELKRRRVFRVAALYGVVAWIIAEVSSVVFPVLLLPEWTVTFIVVLLMLGFPVAMVLAWAFDIGPQGIERTPPVAAAAGSTRRSHAWLVYGGLLVLAMAALGWLLWARLMPPQLASYESVAVMPFANLSGDPANDYFSDGMAEELLNLLAQVPGLQVAARTSSFAYRDQNVDVREIGRALGVDAVLEGSVRRSGERVRITAQLIDTSTGYHLWSQNYDRQMADIFSVQDEISSEIVMALTGTLGTRQAPEGLPVRTAPTDSVEAYTLYLQARHQWKRRGAEPVRRSIALLEEALELDPEFARAWAGLAAAWVVLPGYVGEAAADYHTRATEAARRALAKDPNLAEAHAVLAQIESHEGDWSAADAAFFFAISLEPNDATARHWYSLLLGQAGRLKEALAQATTAYDLDPASPIINYNLAQHLIALGYNERAARHLRSAVELGFDSAADPGGDAMLALRRGDPEPAARLIGARLQRAGAGEDITAAVEAAFADRAFVPQLEARLDAAGVPPETLGDLWILLGEDDRAIRALTAAAKKGKQGHVMAWYPEARGLRMHPEFAALAEATGLMDYWKQFGMPDDCRLVDGRLACGFTTLAAAADPGSIGP